MFTTPPTQPSPLHLGDCAPGATPADQLGLVQAVDRLGQGVVIAVALGADRGNDAGVLQAGAVADRQVLDTSKDYAALDGQLGVTLSLGRKGECWDNAVSESWFATFKNELIDARPWPTRAGLRRAVFDYIEGWYNLRRLHSSLSYRSPAKYENCLALADEPAA